MPPKVAYRPSCHCRTRSRVGVTTRVLRRRSSIAMWATRVLPAPVGSTTTPRPPCLQPGRQRLVLVGARLAPDGPGQRAARVGARPILEGDLGAAQGPHHVGVGGGRRPVAGRRARSQRQPPGAAGAPGGQPTISSVPRRKRSSTIRRASSRNRRAAGQSGVGQRLGAEGGRGGDARRRRPGSPAIGRLPGGGQAFDQVEQAAGQLALGQRSGARAPCGSPAAWRRSSSGRPDSAGGGTPAPARRAGAGHRPTRPSRSRSSSPRVARLESRQPPSPRTSRPPSSPKRLATAAVLEDGHAPIVDRESRAHRNDSAGLSPLGPPARSARRSGRWARCRSGRRSSSRRRSARRQGRARPRRRAGSAASWP